MGFFEWRFGAGALLKGELFDGVAFVVLHSTLEVVLLVECVGGLLVEVA